MKIIKESIRKAFKPHETIKIWHYNNKNSFKDEWSNQHQQSIPKKTWRNLDKYAKIIFENMDDVKVPKWYRGLSQRQKDAARALSSAIHDDCKQETSHRVRRLIISMGLTPIPGQQTLEKLIPMCANNDVAFLWFLMESCYRSESEDHYNINAQIILSCIADLEMYSTMMALEKILPTPPLEQPQNLTSKKNETLKRTSHKKSKYLLPFTDLPYFLRQPKPKERRLNLHYSQSGCPLFKSPTKAQFKYTYKKPNEENTTPWYKHYALKPAERLIHSILQEQINNIFRDFMCANIKPNEVKILCRHHKFIEQLETSAEKQLKALEKQKQKEIRTIFKKENKNYAQVIDRLKCDVEKYRQEIHEEFSKYRLQSTMNILSHGFEDNETHYKQYKPDAANNFISSRSYNFLYSERKSAKYETFKNQKDDNRPEYCNSTTDTKSCNCSNCDDYCDCHLKKSQNVVNGLYESFNLPVNNRPSLDSFNKKYLSDSDDKKSVKMNFFHCNSNNSPYKFDYRAIFNTNDQDKHNDRNIQLKQAFVEAVDSDITLLNQLDRDPCDLPDYANVINEATKKYFKDTHLDNKLEQQNELNRGMPFDESAQLKEKFYYNLSYYDPNDDKLMDDMLKTALNILRQDAQYVLPSLPNVHRLPILREWIRLHYGKIYRMKCTEMKNLTLNEESVLWAFTKMASSIRKPSARKYRLPPETNYKHRDSLIQISKEIRTNFYKRIDKCALSFARAFYLAMFPNHLSINPPDATFFAYMPAFINDNKYIHPYSLESVRRVCMWRHHAN